MISNNTHNRYIPEIDGLRAIAVTSVILFHSQVNIFGTNLAGGYLGVDIFFVISGYLITKLILNEIKTNKSFSFKNFYIRRFRRLMPMILVVCLLTYILAWIFLLPQFLVEYLKSMMSGIFFSANFFFYFNEVEYNATSSLYKPLLHLWSLSVEEQFYLVYPIVLLTIYKNFKNNLSIFFIFVGILSFILSLVLSFKNPSLSFYILPTRIWELLIGALAARMHLQNHQFIKNRYHLFFQALGLILIFFSFFYFKIENLIIGNDIGALTVTKIFSTHPGFFSIMSVIGAFLIIIFTNSGGFINKLLSFKPIVFIGLISYSLYLWHYPIFSLLRISTFETNGFFKIILFASSILILSILSYLIIEKPFRNKEIMNTKTVFIYCGSIIVLMIFLSYHGIKNNGYNGIVPEFLKSLDLKTENNYRVKNFINGENILLIGDSHAVNIKQNLKRELEKRNINLFNLDFSSIFSLDYTLRSKNGLEDINLNNAFNEIIKNENISSVILISRVPLYLSRKGFNNEEGGEEIIKNIPYFIDNDKALPSENRIELISNSFNESILKILNKDINVIIIYPVPEAGYSVPAYLAKNILPKFRLNYLKKKLFSKDFFNSPLKNTFTTSYEVYLKRNKNSFKMLDVINNSNLFRVYPHKELCNKTVKKRCVVHSNQNIYYRDTNHLTKSGIKIIISPLMNVIDKIYQ